MYGNLGYVNYFDAKWYQTSKKKINHLGTKQKICYFDPRVRDIKNETIKVKYLKPSVLLIVIWRENVQDFFESFFPGKTKIID